MTKKQAVQVLETITELAYKNAKNSFTLPGLGKLVLVNRKARVGQRTDLDKLILDVWTDGSISVEDAVAYAAKLLSDHVALFINFEGELEPVEEVVKDEKAEKLRQLLKMRVDELELSVRSANCLRAANIHTLADLVKNQESDMLKYKNFGRKSLIELNQILANLGLSFGMDVEKTEILEPKEK
jgi:DNA-directed RNA polymerase subunit alpha